MNRFTRTSNAALTAALLLLLTFLGSGALAAVTVRVSSELGRGTAQSVRPRAVTSALAQAVGSIASRHTFPAQRTEKSQEYKAVLAKAQSFVTRYSIEEESVEEGVYRMKLSADVDRDALLRELEAAGLSVAKLDAPPRVLVAPGNGERSVEVARLVSAQLNSEGIPAQALQEQTPDPGPLVGKAAGGGFHILAFVTGAVPKPATDEEGNDPSQVGPAPDASKAEPEAPVTVEMAFAGILLDTHAGATLGSEDLALAGDGQTLEDALDAVSARGAEDLFGALIADLVKSEWKLGDAALPMELKVGGLVSPSQVGELTALLTSMPEFRSVELARIGPRLAAWTARAVNPDGDLVGALSRVKPERGVLQWRSVPPAKGKAPVLEGLWTPK